MFCKYRSTQPTGCLVMAYGVCLLLATWVIKTGSKQHFNPEGLPGEVLRNTTCRQN